MSGTFVFADTLDKVFDDLFANRSEEVDAQVQGEVLFSDDSVAATPQGAATAARSTRCGRSTAWPPPSPTSTLGFGAPTGARRGRRSRRCLTRAADTARVVDPRRDAQPVLLVEGSRGGGEQRDGVNVAAAEDGEFEVGDTITVSSQFGNRDYTLVGLVRFGEADSSAGAVSAEFTLAEAQFLAGVEGEVAEIWARAVEAVAGGAGRQHRPVLPDRPRSSPASRPPRRWPTMCSRASPSSRALSVFAGIALLVGIFLIYNTFSILVAQRTRELALLRAVGASRRQVLTSVLLEALVVGLIAGVLGLRPASRWRPASAPCSRLRRRIPVERPRRRAGHRGVVGSRRHDRHGGRRHRPARAGPVCRRWPRSATSPSTDGRIEGPPRHRRASSSLPACSTFSWLDHPRRHRRRADRRSRRAARGHRRHRHRAVAGGADRSPPRRRAARASGRRRAPGDGERGAQSEAHLGDRFRRADRRRPGRVHHGVRRVGEGVGCSRSSGSGL